MITFLLFIFYVLMTYLFWAYISYKYSEGTIMLKEFKNNGNAEVALIPAMLWPIVIVGFILIEVTNWFVNLSFIKAIKWRSFLPHVWIWNWLEKRNKEAK